MDEAKVYNLLSDIKADTKVLLEKVSKLEGVDAHTRLIKLESRNKYVNTAGGLLLSLIVSKDYLIRLFLG